MDISKKRFFKWNEKYDMAYINKYRYFIIKIGMHETYVPMN